MLKQVLFKLIMLNLISIDHIVDFLQCDIQTAYKTNIMLSLNPIAINPYETLQNALPVYAMVDLLTNLFIDIPSFHHFYAVPSQTNESRKRWRDKKIHLFETRFYAFPYPPRLNREKFWCMQNKKDYQGSSAIFMERQRDEV